MKSIQELDRLFNPSSLAVIGASKYEQKGGGYLLKGIIRSGFKGRLYPVNPKESEIMGLRSYPSILDIPGEVDLAIIAVPARIVPQVMAECGQKSVKFVVVHSVGFSELGAQGRELENEVLQIARQSGTRFVGPNCLGLYCPEVGINTVIPDADLDNEAGPVAFLGQSGWVSENIVLMGYERGLRFSKVISIGNQSDLTIEDFLEYFAADAETKVIVCYIEGIKRGREFLQLSKQISKKKPIIVWKGGRTEAGIRAAASHTGSLASDDAVLDAALKQGGIASAQNLEELIDLAVGSRLWFLDDASISLESLGGLGYHGDEALKIRLATTTGLYSLDTDGLTPEDLQLVNRSLLPYPVDKVLFDQVAGGSDTGPATTPTNEYPGVSVEGVTNNTVVTAELVATWNRRLRQQESIRRGDDASEAPVDGEVYDVDGDDGDGFVNLGNGASVDGVTGTVHLQPVDSGAATLRIRSHRALGGDTLNGFTDPEVLAQIAVYRQLLINPHFDDAVAGRGWTVVSGSVDYPEDADSYGFNGKHRRGADDDCVTEQVVDLTALTPAGGDLVLEFELRDLYVVSIAANVSITMITENAGGADLDTVTTGLLSPTNSSWDDTELRITGIHADAVQVRITIDTRYFSTTHDGAVDRMDLRFAPAISAQLVVNGGFNNSLASWNVTNMSQVPGGNNSEGAGIARGDDGQTACNMWQEFNLPGGFVAGDVIRFRCIRYDDDPDDTLDVKLEARDSGGGVLRTVSSSAENVNGSNWVERVFYMRIPNTTTKFRTTATGVSIDSVDFGVGWDNVSAYIYDIT